MRRQILVLKSLFFFKSEVDVMIIKPAKTVRTHLAIAIGEVCFGNKV
jgi:hypothetical protein